MMPPAANDSDNRRYRGDAQVIHLPLDLIAPGDRQARTHFNDEALDELAASIRESGIIHPVVVTGDRHRGYRLLAGERRWRAAQRAGLDTLPAIVHNHLRQDESAVLGLIENLQRESLGVMDTAHGLARLSADHGLTHGAIAQRIGKSRVYVTNFLRLRQLAEPVQALLDASELNLGHAKILAGIESTRQVELARMAATRRMSVRQLERAARAGTDGRAPRTGSNADSDMARLESRLSEHVGNAVHIQYEPERRRGELRIAFHDLDEFDGLLKRLGYEQ